MVKFLAARRQTGITMVKSWKALCHSYLSMLVMVHLLCHMSMHVTSMEYIMLHKLIISSAVQVHHASTTHGIKNQRSPKWCKPQRMIFALYFCHFMTQKTRRKDLWTRNHHYYDRHSVKEQGNRLFKSCPDIRGNQNLWYRWIENEEYTYCSFDQIHWHGWQKLSLPFNNHIFHSDVLQYDTTSIHTTPSWQRTSTCGQ